MKNFLFKVVMLAFVLIFVVVLFFSMKSTVQEEITSKGAETEYLTDSEQSSSGMFGSKKSEQEYKYNGLSDILREIRNSRGNPIDDVYDFYNKTSSGWDGKESETLKEYFKRYFEIRFALDFCKKLGKDVSKQKNHQSDFIGNLNYEQNPYLRGEKELRSGIASIIDSTSTLQAFMKRNKKVNVEIPVADLITEFYRYGVDSRENDKFTNKVLTGAKEFITGLTKEGIKGAGNAIAATAKDFLTVSETTEFVNITRKYETNVIAAVHNVSGSSITQNDMLVLELRVAQLLFDCASEKKEAERQRLCSDLLREIEILLNTYGDLSEQGKYKEVNRFFTNARNYTTDIQVKKDGGVSKVPLIGRLASKAGVKGENEKAREAALSFVKGNIPYMYN